MAPMTATARRNIIALMKRLRDLPDAQYLQYLIAYHAAPTLFGFKPASLVCPDATGRNLGQALDTCVPCLARMFGVKVAVFRNRAGAPLYLVYHPEALRSTLSMDAVRELLAEAGYDTEGGLEDHLTTLGGKCRGRCFPHEIGVFLGYPPADVRRFMAEGGRGFRMAGCWKVYDREAEARKNMERFTAMKMRAAELIARGADLGEVAEGLREAAA